MMVRLVAACIALVLASGAIVGVVDCWTFVIFGHQVSWIDWTDARAAASAFGALAGLFTTLMVWAPR